MNNRKLLPVIAVAGMAFEAAIARGSGNGRNNGHNNERNNGAENIEPIHAIHAARADLLERALSDALARGASAVISFGTAGGLAPDLTPGTLVVADAVAGPSGLMVTDARWSARLADALMAAWASSASAALPVSSASPVPAASSGTQARVRRGVEAAVAAPVVSIAGKAALFRATGALAVDMESHLAATAAAAHGVPFAVCRAIVDPAWRSLPAAALAGLRDDGSTAVWPVLCELARAPRQLGALLQVAADARAARAALVEARRVLARTGVLFSPHAARDDGDAEPIEPTERTLFSPHAAQDDDGEDFPSPA